jgi:mono/diheme cytochrome c family protein/glucose/arabinose dehydrogenase
MGDGRDTEQAPPPAEWSIPAPVRTPEEALKTFRLQPGFRIELVAAEPLVEAPVALDFDADGRLWVVEMRSFMPDADGTGELAPINRIVVLDDTDDDGRMDRRTVYMDGLHLPRLVKVLRSGVVVAEPPNLWFTRDTDGDGVADEKTALASDFSVQEANPEVGGNGMLWGLDNWLIASTYNRRFRFQDGAWISSPVVSRGQWGQSMDDYGRLFTNSNSDYMRADLVPPHYPARNPRATWSSQLPSGVNYQLDANQELWPIRVTPGVNRGYQKGALRPEGTLRNFTSVCGPLIYRGDNFPGEYYGNYFAAEPAAHVIRRSLITEQNGVLSGRSAYDGEEFLGSTDERFRPVNLYTAPDGSLYVVDMYRGILQHRQFMTTYLRRQIVERRLDEGGTFGRIYRVVRDDKPAGPRPSLSRAAPAELVAHLSHPNGWWRDTARRLLVEIGDSSVAPRLRDLATSLTTTAAIRLQAVWTLEGLGTLDAGTLAAMMADRDPKLRAAAVRLSEPMVRARQSEIIERVVARAADPSRDVRLQVMLSLAEAPPEVRDSVLAALARKDAGAPFVIPAIVSSLAGGELAFLERLAADPAWRDARAGDAQLVEALAAAILRSGEAPQVSRLLELVRLDTEPTWRRLALLNGMQASGVRRIPVLPRDLEAAAADPNADVAEGARALLAHLDWPGRTLDGPPPLTAAEQQRFERGRTVYASTCAACHQLDGRGIDGLAPPLVDSPWVVGAERSLARIALKGKAGTFAAPMPPLETMSDADLAAALTYVRRSWGHDASALVPGLFSTMRREITLRSRPYTAEELNALAAQERDDGR